MKALISFRPEQKKAPFLVTRLRKNIKGALELAGVGYVESLAACPDVTHILSPLELPLASDSLEDGVPYVVSALYCEEDEDGAFLEREKGGSLSLSSKAKKLLAEAKAIFVPSEFALYTLRSLGVDNRIDIVPPGVNLARFESNDPIEEEAFARYFRFSKGSKYVLSIGDFSHEEQILMLQKVANMAPNYRFFFVDVFRERNAKRFRKREKNLPKNVIVTSILDDNLYRSAMMGASAYLLFGDEIYNGLTIYECYASKVPLLAIGRSAQDDLVNNKLALYFENETDVAEYLLTLSRNENSSSIILGYEKALQGSLKRTGERIRNLYSDILGKKETL